MPAQGPASNRRQSAPKVRTGCLTCKRRHKKCDEAKPTCVRCRNDGVQCDGYLQAISVSARSKADRKLYVTHLPKFVDADVGCSEPEKRFFYYFRKSAISAFHPLSQQIEVWNNLLLRRSQRSEAIRHALIALGTAHWVFSSRATAQVQHHDIQKMKDLTLCQYNLAIRDLRSDPSVDLHIVLICCLIFVCLESVLGRYAESLKHLHAGSRVLLSALPPIGRVNGSTQSEQAEDPRQRDDISKIVEMFSLMGFDAHLFMDKPVLENLTPYSRISTEDQESVELVDLTQARQTLHAIWLDFARLLERSQEDADLTSEREAIYRRVRLWITRFDRLVDRLHESRLSKLDRERLIGLRFLRQNWVAVFHAMDGKLHETVLTEWLDLAEALMQPLRGSRSTTFYVRGDIINGLAFICDKSQSKATQQRAINMLRSLHLREGLWDSYEMAEYLEGLLKAREASGQRTRSDGGIPGNVRVLSEMNMLALSENSGLLVMTKQSAATESSTIAPKTRPLVRYQS